MGLGIIWRVSVWLSKTTISCWAVNSARQPTLDAYLASFFPPYSLVVFDFLPAAAGTDGLPRIVDFAKSFLVDDRVRLTIGPLAGQRGLAAGLMILAV